VNEAGRRRRWSPRIWHKLTAIALTLIIPLALTTWFLVDEARFRIDFVGKEIQGVNYLRPLSSVLVHLSEHRSLARRALQGDADAEAERAALATAVDSDFAALVAADGRMGEALRTTPADLEARSRARSTPALLAADWQSLRDKLAGPGTGAGDATIDEPGNEALHLDLLLRIRDLISHVGDSSQLILDPDLDTYYVMDALLLKEPELIEQVTSAGGTVERLVPRGFSFSDLVSLGGSVTLLKSTAEGMNQNLEIAFDEATRTGKPDVEPALGPLLNRAVGSVTELIRVTAQDVIFPASVQVDTPAYGALVDHALETNAALWTRLLDEEQKLLEIRRHTDLDRRAFALRSVLVAVALSLVLIFVLARRISRNVGAVAEASAELAAGDLSRRADVRSGDEVGAMATAFNGMADQLQASVESIEETVRERTQELSERTSSLQLLQAVAVAANEAETVEEALQITLDRVCASTGWPVGHGLLRVDPDGPAGPGDPDREPVLVSSGVWHLDDEQRFGVFRRVTTEYRFTPGVGLPGRVLAAAKPAFIEDLAADGNFPRFEVSRDLNVRAGMAFPVLVNREVVAVLEFFSSEPAQPTPGLLELMENVGTQLGRVIERARAEETLQRSKEEAESANRTKSAFLASMSHELRTPLNAIIGYSEILEEDLSDLGEEQMVADVDKIRRSGKHLLGVINDVLDLSKIEAGKMDLYLETFDVAALVDEVTATVRPMVERGGNALVARADGELGQMRADASKVRQALLNLLSNSAKFTEAGTVTLDVRRSETERGAWVTMAVTDTGIGLSPEQLTQLFQPFTQVDSSPTRRYGGTGLGLVISRDFCRLMGGEIGVESELGRGSTFTIRLPAVVADPGADSPAGRAASAAGASVLVVDDDPAVRELLQRFLSGDGYRVATAADGDEGLRVARALGPRVIVLDVVMPREDGWSLLSRLKSDPALRDIPVIVLSVVDEKATGYSLGAAEYMTKPIDRDKLAAMVRRHVHAAPQPPSTGPPPTEPVSPAGPAGPTPR
jgi:signal transduction histidine kinase/ActR/RegA family two-component response regulator/HAMP domain-containing protein